MAFPTSIEASTYFGEAYNNLSTTLSQKAGISDTTVYVASTNNWPSIGWITMEDEIRSYTGKTTGSFTGCTPGSDNTTAAEHAAGKTVSLTFPAIMWTRIVAELRATQTALGASLANIATLTNTVTLTNKTLTTPTLTKPVINGTNPTGATYTPATGAQTVALDCATNNMHIVTGHADGTAITFTVANATNSQPFIVSILQGAVVSTITAWFATVRWADGSTPTLTATVGKRDTFGFIRTGANTYDGFIVGQNL